MTCTPSLQTRSHWPRMPALVTNGNYVAIVIAGIANPDYAPIDTALETALNF